MTATASEGTGAYRAFENQESLTAATMQVFGDFGMEFVTKVDHAGRPYVETSVYPDADHLVRIATTALDRMGFEDASVLALREFLALQEMKAIYEDFSIDDSGEDAYLSGGMWITSDGRLIKK